MLIRTVPYINWEMILLCNYTLDDILIENRIFKVVNILIEISQVGLVKYQPKHSVEKDIEDDLEEKQLNQFKFGPEKKVFQLLVGDSEHFDGQLRLSL